VTLWQMVAGRLPPWAGQEGQQADAQQQQAAAAAAASPDVLLPLQPPLGAACHAVPKALQFPAHFSAVRGCVRPLCVFAHAGCTGLTPPAPPPACLPAAGAA
jgi:hypothetical protein